MNIKKLLIEALNKDDAYNTIRLLDSLQGRDACVLLLEILSSRETNHTLFSAIELVTAS